MRSCPSRSIGLVIALAVAVTHGAAAYLVALVTWNDSPSVPRGLYLRRPALSVTAGSTVILPVPASVRNLVAERGYFPARNTLMKIIAALPGDHVCLDGDRYRVNGLVIADVRHEDTRGRPLPVYRFCDTVPAGQAFVATAAPLSFDSRYFGPVPLSALTVVTPLWMCSR